MSTPNEIDPATVKSLDALLQKMESHTPAIMAVNHPLAQTTTLPQTTPVPTTGGILAQLSAGPRLEDADLDDDEDDDDQDISEEWIRRVNPKQGNSSDVIIIPGEVRLTIHYLENEPDLTCGVVCPGTGCPLCDLEYKPKNTSLKPAYNVALDSVGVLAVTLDSQWKPERSNGRYKPLSDKYVRAVKSRDLSKTLVSIKHARNGYTVTATDLPPDFTIPPEVLTAFEQRIGQDPDYITSCFARRSVEELRSLPSVARRLKVKGK